MKQKLKDMEEEAARLRELQVRVCYGKRENGAVCILFAPAFVVHCTLLSLSDVMALLAWARHASIR